MTMTMTTARGTVRGTTRGQQGDNKGDRDNDGHNATTTTTTTCQDQFFADLIFRGVRGSGHGLVVRPKGYVAWSRFPKGRKAD